MTMNELGIQTERGRLFGAVSMLPVGGQTNWHVDFFLFLLLIPVLRTKLFLEQMPGYCQLAAH